MRTALEPANGRTPQNSLITGKLTGNFADSGPQQRFRAPNRPANSKASDRIPYATEQGSFGGITGKIFEVTSRGSNSLGTVFGEVAGRPRGLSAMTHQRRTPSPGDHEVGYGRPPSHTRFRKGASGNPGGRPRGMTARRAIELALKEAYRPITVRGDKTSGDPGRAAQPGRARRQGQRPRPAGHH